MEYTSERHKLHHRNSVLLLISHPQLPVLTVLPKCHILMSTISSFIQQRLADIQSSVANRIETNDVLLDMVAVIEEFHEAEERKKHIREIETANSKNAALQKEIERLRQEKNDSDAELMRIKMEAEVVRDALIHEVGYILYESKSIQKQKERIHELENRVLELSQQRPIMTVLQASPSSSSSSNSSSSPLPPTPPDHVSTHLSAVNEPPSTPMNVPLSVRTTQSPVPLNDFASHSATIRESNGSNDVTHPVVELSAAESDRESRLLRLDNRMLLVITSFLSRKDTMQIARLNRRLFVRLNVLLGMESKIETTTWGVCVTADISINEGLTEQKLLPPPVIVATTKPAAHTTASSSTKSKFSMLFAAADNVLPSSLTAGMMTVVGAVGIGRDRSSSGSSTKQPPLASSGTTTSPMPLPLLSPGVGVGVAYSPLRGDAVGAGGIAATGYPPSAVGNGGPGLGPGQGHYNDMFSREMADSLAKKLSCTYTCIVFFVHVIVAVIVVVVVVVVVVIVVVVVVVVVVIALRIVTPCPLTLHAPSSP